MSIKSFFRWSRDNQSNFAAAISKELANKIGRDSPELTDKLSKNGGTITGVLIMEIPGASSNQAIMFKRPNASNLGGIYLGGSAANAELHSYIGGYTLVQSRTSLHPISSATLGTNEKKWESLFATKINTSDIAIDTDSMASITFTEKGNLLKAARITLANGLLMFRIGDNSKTLSMSMPNSSTLIFKPAGGSIYEFGGAQSYEKWTRMFAANLNNGADIAIPTKAGTLALLSDVEDILKKHGLIQ